MTALTPRQKIVLAALSADVNAQFAPVQIQKLFFLIDENVSEDLGGKLFSFAPYDYGPFDAGVYRDLEMLKDAGLANIGGGNGALRRYSLTPSGYEAGRELLAKQAPRVARFFSDASTWVRSLPFAQLVGSIYKAYPHMKANSVFVER